METIADLGEHQLLQRLKPYCSEAVGDDGACLPPVPNGWQLVMTTDMLIDGVHFSDRTMAGFDVGWKAAAVNLSDVAAMGGLPQSLVMALGLPPETPTAWVEAVYQGFSACLRQYGGQLVGGDTVRSPIRTLSVTATGVVPREYLIQRHLAQAGDVVLITGPHGRSRGGLELLWQGTPQRAPALVLAHRRPRPRIDVVQFLHTLPPTPIAGMDSSDGLADAILQICQASRVGIHLNSDLIPLDAALGEQFPNQALQWTLYGGEDFELVLALPEAIAQPILTRFPESAIIGTLTAAPGDFELDGSQTFQHFAPPKA
ncbi:MAG: thiamine-phosphate kinase [Oscillatoriales cyanobacterium SM2_2_1]|nr:thiamine-phosphate kinase [Oscillatoriales cyanobacterium SM2_2_1]